METSEWELTAGCSRRRPRSGDFLCALWVVGIPHPASSKGRRSSVECGRDPHLRVRLHNTVGLTKPHPCQNAARPSATLESASSPRRLARSWSVPTAQARRRCQVQNLRTSGGS